MTCQFVEFPEIAKKSGFPENLQERTYIKLFLGFAGIGRAHVKNCFLGQRIEFGET